MQLQLQLIRTYIAQFSMEHDQMRFTSSYKTSRLFFFRHIKFCKQNTTMLIVLRDIFHVVRSALQYSSCRI